MKYLLEAIKECGDWDELDINKLRQIIEKAIYLEDEETEREAKQQEIDFNSLDHH